MTHPSDSHDAAMKMQNSINEKIAEACSHLSPCYFKEAAQRVIDEDSRMEGWEYVWSEPIGMQPFIALTHYVRPAHRG